MTIPMSEMMFWTQRLIMNSYQSYCTTNNQNTTHAAVCVLSHYHAYFVALTALESRSKTKTDASLLAIISFFSIVNSRGNHCIILLSPRDEFLLSQSVQRRENVNFFFNSSLKELNSYSGWVQLKHWIEFRKKTVSLFLVLLILNTGTSII